MAGSQISLVEAAALLFTSCCLAEAFPDSTKRGIWVRKGDEKVASDVMYLFEIAKCILKILNFEMYLYQIAMQQQQHKDENLDRKR